MTDYKKQAEDFLKKHGASVKIELAGDQSAPLWAKEGEKHGLKYNITIERAGKTWNFSFWGSIADREKIEAIKTEKTFKVREKRYFSGEFSFSQEKMKLKKQFEAGEFTPSAYDVLAVITKYDPGTFDDFVSEYGYSNFNGLKEYQNIMNTYLAVIDEYKNIERIFGDCIDELREIN